MFPTQNQQTHLVTVKHHPHVSHPSSLLLALRLWRLVQRALAQEAAGVIEALLAADGFVGPGRARAEHWRRAEHWVGSIVMGDPQ